MGFSGNVLIAQHDRIVLNHGYGFADREAGSAMQPNTVISIGSLTKQFTAAAILKLEMQGRLRVTDRIGRFFPNVPAPKQAITIHELLTHTAGLQPDYGSTDYEPVDRQTYIDRVMHAPLDSKPGSTFAYSNGGYSLLAAIIEIVSHQSYEEYVRANIFLPAGMHDTGYRLARWALKDIAVGYDDGQRWGTIPSRGWAPDGPYWNLRGNGGIESTPADMFAWHLALKRNTVLSAAARSKYEQGYVFEGPLHRSKYSYGWSVQSTPHGKLVTHNGGNGIYSADFLRFVDNGTVIYLASTNSKLHAGTISRSVARLAFGDEVSTPPAVVTLPSLEKYTGTYATADGANIEVASQDEHLNLRTSQPATFAALNSSEMPPDLLEKLIARTNAFVRKPPDADHPVWQRIVNDLGAIQSATIIGGVAEAQDPAIWSFVRGSNGSKYVEFLWNVSDIDGIRAAEVPPALALYPESAQSFFSYNARNGKTVRVNFLPDGILRIGEGDHAIVARRKTP